MEMHERQGFKPGTLTTGSKGPWLARAKALSLSTIAELSDEQAYQPFHFPWDSDNPISYGELQLYTLRHGPRTCGPTEPLSRTAWHPW